MLTKQDLDAIDKLIEKIISGVEKNLGERLSKIEERMGNLEDRATQIEQKLIRVEKSLLNRISMVERRVAEVEENLEARVEEESLEVQKQITFLKYEMKKEFKQVHKDQNLIIKHFNEEFLGLQSRVKTLEQGHLSNIQ